MTDGLRGYDESTYGERWADVYDDWYDDPQDTAAAVAFLAGLDPDPEPHAERNPGMAVAGRPASSGPVIIELGIGTGRLALGLQALGFDVRGVDASPAMVERLRAKAGGADLPVTIGDMASFGAPRRSTDPDDPDDLEVRGIFVASNTFFNLATEAAQRACLTRVGETLAPGGWFVAAAYVPSDASDIGRGSDVRVRSLEADRLVLTADVHDAEHQTVSGQFVDISAAGITLRPFHIRYLYPAQFDALASDAGLIRVARWASWTGEPFDDASDAHVTVYRRP